MSCKCRICEIGIWMDVVKLPNKFQDHYLNDGLNLEGIRIDFPTFKNKLIYELHHIKPIIRLKYLYWRFKYA